MSIAITIDLNWTTVIHMSAKYSDMLKWAPFAHGSDETFNYTFKGRLTAMVFIILQNLYK